MNILNFIIFCKIWYSFKHKYIYKKIITKLCNPKNKISLEVDDPKESSEDKLLDDLEYENVHLTYDDEKSPKFN